MFVLLKAFLMVISNMVMKFLNFAIYQEFKVGSSGNNYGLQVSMYSGSAGKSRALVLLSNSWFLRVFYISENVNVYFTNSWTNTRHVCTLLKAFLMVIPNMVMKFLNFEIIWTFCNILYYMSSAHACRMVGKVLRTSRTFSSPTPYIYRRLVSLRYQPFVQYHGQR